MFDCDLDPAQTSSQGSPFRLQPVKVIIILHN